MFICVDDRCSSGHFNLSSSMILTTASLFFRNNLIQHSDFPVALQRLQMDITTDGVGVHLQMWCTKVCFWLWYVFSWQDLQVHDRSDRHNTFDFIWRTYTQGCFDSRCSVLDSLKTLWGPSFTAIDQGWYQWTMRNGRLHGQSSCIIRFDLEWPWHVKFNATHISSFYIVEKGYRGGWMDESGL